MKSNFDFDRVKMTDKVDKSFRKGEKLLPAYMGQKIRFVDGVSDPLTPQQIAWALSFQDGKQFEPCKDRPMVDSPTAIGQAKDPILPPLPPGLDEDDGLSDVDDGQDDGEGGDDGKDEGFPGESQGAENISDYKADDAIDTISGEENPEMLDFYQLQEEAKGNKARKTVLQAIQERKAELAG